MLKLIQSTFYREKETKRKLTAFLQRANMLSFGRECERFEDRFARWQGRKHCIFVNSGSSANLAVVQCLLNLGKLKKGDLVGFSALTWSTNVMPLIQLGLRPVPIDVDLPTLNVTSRTLGDVLERFPLKAVFLTNLLGFCGDIDAIASLCKKEGMHLIEDNCESLGTVYQGKKLGNFGFSSTFSFYVGHHFSTIEGGAVCCDDEAVEVMLQLIRAHGWDRNVSFANQHAIRDHHHVNSSFYSRYTFYELGFNFRPTEINGFLGNVQLSYLDEMIVKRNKNFLDIAVPLYERTDRYYPVTFDHIDVVSNFAIPLICRTRNIRDALVKKCEGKIEIRPIVGGDMTQQPFFKKYIGKDHFAENKNARLVHEQGLYIGNNPDLSSRDKALILKTFLS